jgi:exonuclease SbcD
MLKMLHTSDWHLGQNFFSQSRLEEHKAFLAWLLETIKEHKIDLLVVAGDIFDTNTPPNYALELYYNFLSQLSQGCSHVVIIAGNHDSVATLKAPQKLLQALHISVITSGDASEDEIVEIYKEQKLEAIVCGVPFLRDYVVREALAGQTIKEKEESLTQGIINHYTQVYNEALQRKGERDVPIIATGHFTTVGATNSDSQRDIYIGNSLNIQSSFLANMFDYVALGHLHKNQKVDYEHVRYSGSIIPLSFSEADEKKKVNIVSLDTNSLRVEEVVIPTFRKLYLLKGDTQTLLDSLSELANSQDVWVEIHLRDDNPLVAHTQLRQKAQEVGVKILALKVQEMGVQLQSQVFQNKTLEELTPQEVFEQRVLEENITDETLKKNLKVEFLKIVDEVQNR